jgi:hypothetical protein
MAFRSRQVLWQNNNAIDNPVSAEWTNHEAGQVIALTGREVECRSSVPLSHSMETLGIDKFGRLINGNDGLQ